MRSRPLILAVALTAVAAVPGAAAILVVDCAGGPFFDIGSAVLAAGPGDTVVVHECTVFPFAYPPFTVLAKDRVHVVAADVTEPTAMGGQRVGFGTVPLTLFNPVVVVDGTLLSPSSCVSIDSSFGVAIKGLKLINCVGAGVAITFSGETTVVGNRIQNAMGGIREGDCRSTHIIGNMIVSSTGPGIAVGNSSFALIADNQVGNSSGDGILITATAAFVTAAHVVNNQIVGNAGAGIRDQAIETRIERNTVLSNGGPAQIVIDAVAVDADAVGNITGFSILNLGAGTEMQDNQ